MLQDGRRRATTHHLTEVMRNDDPLCKFVATCFADLCPVFVASEVAPPTMVRHVIYFADKFEPLRTHQANQSPLDQPDPLARIRGLELELFVALGSKIIGPFRDEAQLLSGNAGVSDAIILVGGALTWLLKPVFHDLGE